MLMVRPTLLLVPHPKLDHRDASAMPSPACTASPRTPSVAWGLGSAISLWRVRRMLCWMSMSMIWGMNGIDQSPQMGKPAAFLLAHFSHADRADISFADLFKTALDDFFEDTSVDDALKELGLAKIDDRIPNLSVTLMPHQIIGVAWMVKQEKKTSCAGGILADAMGLGKTIQTIATMVKNPSTDRKIKNTLIILPLPLLQQWKEEIESKSTLSVYIYHGPKRTKSINQLKAVDVVLTTYSIVANEASAMIEPPKRRKKKDDFVDDDEEDEKPRIKQKGLLFKVHWYRCVLDEAAIIRNKATKSHKACMLLDAEIKWCLSVG